MDIINDEILKDILKDAEDKYPKESCGLIVNTSNTLKYIKCNNKADDNSSEDEFIISGEEYSYAEDLGDIVAVVHSHPDATTQPSVRDRAVCSEMGIPWVIVSYPEKDVRVITPENSPLIGREFCHGTDWDCYGLIRDYYLREFGITLNRYDHDSIWWDEGKSLYMDNYHKEGFSQVTDGTLEVGDLFIMNIMSDIPNHGAIYVGNGEILHHLYGRLSRKDVYGGYWKEHTVCTLRHTKLVGEGGDSSE